MLKKNLLQSRQRFTQRIQRKNEKKCRSQEGFICIPNVFQNTIVPILLLYLADIL